MSAATLTTAAGVVDVLEVEITMPRAGAWVARGLTDSDAAVIGAASLRYGAATLVGMLRGRARASTSGAQAFELVGGGGGLAAVVAPRYYRGAPASTVVSDLLRDAGETLSATHDAAMLAGTLAGYVRPEASAGTILRDIVRRVGGTWRTLDDGSVWVGADTWPAVTVDPLDVDGEDAAAGVVTLSPSEIDQRPGTTVLGQRVSAVVHRLAGGSLTSEVWLERGEVEGSTEDRTRAALAALVRLYAPDAALRVYRARVVAQNADATLELRLDAASMPTLSRVPLRLLPGVVARVAVGCRVLVLHEDGELTQPVALLGEGTAAGLVRLEVAGGTSEVGRVGDTVDCGSLTASTPSGVVTWTWQGPTPPGGAAPAPLVSTTLPLVGLISSGAGALRA